MKVAVHNPYRCFGPQTRNHNGYNHQFLKQFKPILYVPEWRVRLNRTGTWREFLRSIKTALRGRFGFENSRGLSPLMRDCGLNPDEFDYAFSVAELKQKADVLICFNGYPYREGNIPVKEFSGLKIYHAYEYVFRATDSHRALADHGVDYVMGYTRHDRHCPFFQRFYPSYAERVIPVPFGFGERFQVKVPFGDRLFKVVALGAVNPVNDPTVSDPEELRDYVSFYADQFWTHQWRRMLVEHEGALTEIMDSHLPHYPKTKDYAYDAVAMLNQYALFANDEGLMKFPPARTYEGTASGAVMVGSDHASYGELGFVDGVNCIMHRRHDVAEFRDKVQFYRQRPEQLAAIAAASVTMVRERYSHAAVAQQLYRDITQIYDRGR